MTEGYQIGLPNQAAAGVRPIPPSSQLMTLKLKNIFGVQPQMVEVGLARFRNHNTRMVSSNKARVEAA
jgi:hypothetical protein